MSVLVPAVTAPEDWRNPRPGGLASDPIGREASWSAVALYRFFPNVTQRQQASSHDH